MVPMKSPRPQPLPPLREDVDLFRSTDQPDGAPTWVLYDSLRQAFFSIGWLELQILSRWGLGTAEAVTEAVRKETGAEPDPGHFRRLIGFLQGNELLRVQGDAGRAALAEHAARSKTALWKWLLKNYLYLRVPLVRPDRFLDKTLPVARFFMSRGVGLSILLAGLFGIFLTLRQWDDFSDSFIQLTTPVGLGLFFTFLLFSKMLHELGHAYPAKHYGLRIPTMGVALLVLWPVLYTDTTEAWKLRFRRQRLAIVVGGMTVELALALLATLLWSLLPDGPLRGAVFMLAAVTWIGSLAINLNPFMRFDGYYLLSDLWNVPNLEARAFAMGRWRLRAFLFGFDDPPPEAMPDKQRRRLVVYAYLTWLYRFFLFLGIALLVYYFFFKLLGIFLFIVEIVWFILRPIKNEVSVWIKRRKEVALDRRLFRTSLLILIPLGILFLPIPFSLHLPAVLKSADFSRVFPPLAGRVEEILVERGDRVRAGDPLFQLFSPDLAQQITEAEQAIELLTRQEKRMTGNDRLRGQQEVLGSKLIEARVRYQGLVRQRDRQRIRSPLSGTVMELMPGIRPGRWVNETQVLALVADANVLKVDAYLTEEKLRYAASRMAGRFISDIPESPSRPVRLVAVNPARVAVLEDPYLASTHGGPITARLSERQEIIPEDALYRLHWRVEPAESPIPAPIRYIEVGEVHVYSGASLRIVDLLNHVFAVLIRESGF
uniref:Putative peptide zinc metalloprotease protein n=1 Tax=Candidatus Kentrum sp. DK TaxID=2126562 RepID=A0A450T0K8_9GAMM|nr:MAG: putative peptide zinc metalloprotease protein [Candidatus Kentron sp. DK]